MDFEIDCQYSEPVNLGTEENPFWAYSKADCILPNEALELIENPTTGAEFYLQKTIDYGGVLILVFLLLFAIFGITKIITDFWIPRRSTGRKEG